MTSKEKSVNRSVATKQKPLNVRINTINISAHPPPSFTEYSSPISMICINLRVEVKYIHEVSKHQLISSREQNYWQCLQQLTIYLDWEPNLQIDVMSMEQPPGKHGGCFWGKNTLRCINEMTVNSFILSPIVIYILTRHSIAM